MLSNAELRDAEMYSLKPEGDKSVSCLFPSDGRDDFISDPQKFKINAL